QHQRGQHGDGEGGERDPVHCPCHRSESEPSWHGEDESGRAQRVRGLSATPSPPAADEEKGLVKERAERPDRHGGQGVEERETPEVRNAEGGRCYGHYHDV